MKMLFFGMYAPNYSRNHILIKGLRQNGDEILECNDRSHLIWGLRYLKLLRKFILVKGWQVDVIFVGFPGQTDMPLAWFLAKILAKKLVFDAFISIYNTRVSDRKELPSGSLVARIWWLIDWLSCCLADKVILDTNAHINYFVQTFHLNSDRFRRVFIGTDTEIIKPTKASKKYKFVVGFHGYYIPLQGVPIIVEAARLVSHYKNIEFQLLGGGIEYEHCRRLANNLRLDNIKFIKKIPYEKLAAFISGADVYLAGPFGNSSKAGLVIPNKAYESIACGIPTIVANTLATRELLSDKQNCLMVPRANAPALARAIEQLYEDSQLRKILARNSLLLAKRNFSPKKIAGDLLGVINQI